ncbi:MAG TPA: hypothetical protein VMB80_06625 [Candidatus Acidoferrum sp.]|nr:hypothetical protein [Candidatus Acidoferrum sp.]
MSKKQWLLFGTLVVLAGVYVRYFTQWFRSPPLLIHHTSRVTNPNPRFRARAAAANAGIEPVTFGFDEPLRLTEIKVVRLAEWQTNSQAGPLWHLVSDSNSVPILDFRYGQGIRGLRPAVPDDQAQPLQPNVPYRLFVQAGSRKGWHDFQAAAKTGAGP